MLSKPVLLALGLPLLFGLVKTQDNRPPLVFNCADIADVCTNMCWGAYCTADAAGSTLTYDSYGGQGRGGSGPTEQCDEYPFASTLDADDYYQVSRCVPQRQNSIQGGLIGAYVRDCGVSCPVQITFGNPGSAGVAYCFAYQDRAAKCINDQNPLIYRRRANQVIPDENYGATGIQRLAGDIYKPVNDDALSVLASGMDVSMPYHSAAGRDTPLNTTVMVAVVIDADNNEYDFVEDTVLSMVSA
ncbi:hypothetical protein KC343_g2731 [Hortaea werneckii]|nr:hypothetical protein KC323_g8525 [Hortaea werneckii]KAI7262158.1 hypothetical protein KC352_g9808 [Hortaea werneckii]KAI7570153.1 hypothetical protein KC317_g2715 [Hortaea werneckii]KAI7623964.1 hypothetical protein KC346_g2445 [Hortaea werneckii]KAI7633784.1 hypothetical protein KC343_g2731 [Hortaea werneckii]